MKNFCLTTDSPRIGYLQAFMIRDNQPAKCSHRIKHFDLQRCVERAGFDILRHNASQRPRTSVESNTASHYIDRDSIAALSNIDMADGFILVQTHSIPTTHPAGLPGMFAKHANGVVNAFRNDTLLLIDEVRLLLKSDETKDATDKTEQPNRRRRSSSLKRMSSIFGDWRAQSSHGVQPDALDTIQEQDPPPSKDALREMLNMNVLDRYRTKVPFNSLVKDGVQRRTVVVFIRHFFCGVGSSRSSVFAQRLTRPELFRIRPRADQRDASGQVGRI